MSYPEDLLVAISALEHYEYCPRQCALIYVDGVWEDNRHTVAGTRSHRRVDSGESRLERGRQVIRSIPLWSEQFGLKGRADAVELYDNGDIIPVEYKSGVRHGLTADIQLCAETLCLEEMLGVSIPVASIWYGGTRRRWRVEVDNELRSATLLAIEAVRALLAASSLPEAPADERCRTCQLEPHCMPDVVVASQRLHLYVQNLVLR